MGILSEQKKTNKLLENQSNQLQDMHSKQNAELRKQTDEQRRQTELLEDSKRQKDYQKYLRDFIYEIKKYSEEIASGKYSPVSSYLAAKIIENRINSENINSRDFEQLQDKEFYSSTISILENVIRNTPPETVEEGQNYLNECESFSRKISQKEQVKNHFKNKFNYKNKFKELLYTLEVSGSDYKEKFNLRAIIGFGISGLIFLIPPPVGLIGFVSIAYAVYYIQKRIPLDYSAVLESLDIELEQGKFITFGKVAKRIEDSIQKTEEDFSNYKDQNYPEVLKFK